jgi:phospholipase C
MANLHKIDHIVVLMLENRSFDHMLGYLALDGGIADIDGLTGEESNLNPVTGNPVQVSPLRRTLFQFSPHHEHSEVMKQVNDGRMDGFLANFLERFPEVDPRFGMGFYDRRSMQAFDFLARRYTVCDRWFCSHPGPTMPNRLCTLTGRTPMLENLSPSDPQIGYLMLTSIFESLDAAGETWAYYESDVGYLRLFRRYRLDDRNVLPIREPADAAGQADFAEHETFLGRVRSGARLPSVTFIDPDYTEIPPVSTANDDHPPADVKNGQQLVREVYNALQASPHWAKTVLVVTYDEHGGFFDHVPPPGSGASTHEGAIARVHPDGPAFLGVRVPTLVISPWAPRGVNHGVFDHTSIAKTIFMRFRNGEVPESYGARTRDATHLGTVLTNAEPRVDVGQIPPMSFSAANRLPQGAPTDDRPGFHDVIKRFGVPRGGG